MVKPLLWRKLTIVVFTAMLVVGCMPFGLGLQTAFGADSTSDAPATEKQLLDNGDGTYTLALSVTGESSTSSTTKVTKANVVLVLDTSNSMNNRISGGGTRLDAEKDALTKKDGIIDNLLKQNVPGDSVKSDIIEVGIVNFGGAGSKALDPTTEATKLKDTINGLQTTTGTNWEEGLRLAKTMADGYKQAQPDEDVYVIFLTDGEPTTHYNDHSVNTNYAEEWGYAKDDARGIVTAGYHFYGLFTWGTSGSTHYLSSLVQYAYTGRGDPNTALDDKYKQYYTDASDTKKLIEALNQIVSEITSTVGYTNVDLDDGVTEMTATNLKTAVDGKVTGLKYYRSGGPYSTTANNGLGEEWADAPAATVKNGTVDWDLGNLVLEDKVTYTVTFVVWPKQESVDLVADLNNGIRSYDSLSDDEKAQIKESGGKYSLKTNTDYPTVTYSTVTTTTVDGKTTTVTSDPKTENIKNPDPVGLATTKLNALKAWEDTLDPSQREEIADVELFLKVDGDYYYKKDGQPLGLTLTKESDWTETGYIAIAPGLMVDEDSPAYDPEATQVTYNGKKYAILEDGHEYVFEENDINNHFELTAYTHHPMIMGEDADGNPHIVDVIFTKDASGKITGIESVSDLSDTLSATNTLKGGINITKKVVDENNNEIDSKDPFSVKVTMKDADGNALPEKTASDGTKYTIDYRIYYGPNNPNYDASATPAGGRSDHIYKTGTSFEETIYVGDTIRVVNVENGTVYTVEEENVPAGYEFDKVDYKIAYGEDDSKADPGPDHTVKGNSASYAEVTNKYTFGDLEVSKTVAVQSGDADKAKAKDFTFKFNLYSDNTKAKELTDAEYNYTITKADGSESTGTIKSNGTFTLKDGEKIHIEKLPEGAYYEVTETNIPEGFKNTSKTGATGTVEKDTTVTAAFTNTYEAKPVSVDPPVQKIIQNNDSLYNKGKFTFNITNTSKPESVTTAPMPKNTEITDSATYELEDRKGYYEFGDITFTAPGTYEYTVTESGEVGGVTNDPDAKTGKKLTFVVTDDGKGNLSVSPTTDQVSLSFTNVYDATGSIKLGATKVLEGRTLKADEFSFTVYDKDGKEVATATNKADGTVEFSTMQYTLKDAGKTFEYTIKENIPENADPETHKLGNITYDPQSYAVDVRVSDGGSGSLTVTADKTAAQVKFTNKYEPFETSAKVNIKKVLEGRTLKAGEFSFKMVPTKKVDGDPVTSDGLTAAVKADGTAELPVTYKKAGTYEYTVSEVKPEPALGGVEYDTTSYPVTVTVEDKDGQLVATVTPSEALSFKNTYTTKGDAKIDITKVYEGKNWTDEKFTFELYGSDGKKIDEKTLTKDEQSSFFELKDLTPGTYEYTLKEVVPGTESESDDQAAEPAANKDEAANTDTPADNAQPENQSDNETPAESANDASQTEQPSEETPSETTSNDEAAAEENDTETGSLFGNFMLVAYAADDENTVETENGVITYDGNSYKVSIVVTDNGDGTCKAEVKYPNGEVVTFTNQYEPNPAFVNPEATKKLTGKDLTEGMFQFKLTGNGTNVTVANDADGKVVFPQMNYTVKDAGKTYKYTVEEVKGDVSGVVYDTNKFTFDVRVVYDKDTGKLTAIMSDSAKSMGFVNTYKPAEVTVNLEAHKTLEGAALKDGEFAFVVVDAEGDVVASGKNDANGKVIFGGLTFTEEGTYTYTIKEVNTGVESFEYDGTEYTATIKVKDIDGRLVAETSIAGGSAEFVNTYIPPAEEDEEDPPTSKKVKTGDAAHLMGWLMLAIASEAGAVYAFRRRRDY